MVKDFSFNDVYIGWNELIYVSWLAQEQSFLIAEMLKAQNCFIEVQEFEASLPPSPSSPHYTVNLCGIVIDKEIQFFRKSTVANEAAFRYHVWKVYWLRHQIHNKTKLMHSGASID